MTEILGKLEVMRTQAVWVFRVLWFLLPLTLGQAASTAVASANHGVPQVMTVGLWVLWTIAMVASMVPLPATLTALRALAPATVPLALWTCADSGWTLIALLGLAHAITVTAVVLNPLIGDRFVDGGSYGDERRMLLRPPTQLSYLLVPLLWTFMVAGVAAGPLLLGNRQWILGVVLALAGAGIVAVGFRALHQLTRRWVVFVPAGMVLHDLMVLTEPVLFRRTSVERLGAALEGTPARDLSNQAAGLLLECELTDPAPLGLRDAKAKGATLSDIRRFLFCPSRPGELLNEAERRNIATD